MSGGPKLKGLVQEIMPSLQRSSKRHTLPVTHGRYSPYREAAIGQKQPQDGYELGPFSLACLKLF